MRRLAQHTKFDEIIQEKTRSYWNQPKQKLLFPKPPAYPGARPEDEEVIEEIEQPRVELDLEYPEITPEHIRTTLDDDFEPQRTSWGEPTNQGRTIDQLVPDKKQLEHAVRKRVFDRYNKLRATATKFYSYYQEANRLATNDDFPVDLNGTYADFFSNYGKLLTHKISRQIGALFGGNLERHTSIKYYLSHNINIFNITSKNYYSVLQHLDNLIGYMEKVILDYEKRKKLLKYVGPKIQEEIDRVMQNPEWIEFFTWMDEYFPNRKTDILKETLSNLEGYRHHGEALRFGDLVKFKTFKQIYEKAQKSSTKYLRNSIEVSITDEIRKEVKDQLFGRIDKLFITLANFIGAVDKEEISSEEKCNKIISFLRKGMNIDLRSVFTFSANATKKSILEYYAPVENLNPNDKPDIQALAAKDIELFYATFPKQVLYFVNNFLSQDKSGTWTAKWGLGGAVEDLVSRLTGNHRYNLDRKRLSEILRMDSRDFDKVAVNFLANYMLKSISGFDSDYSFRTETLRNKKPMFGGIGIVVSQSDGKFSIEGFTNYAHHAAPFVPKEIMFATVKAMFRELDYKSLNNISRLQEDSFNKSLKILVHILKRDSKLDHNNFYKMFKNINKVNEAYDELSRNFPKSFDEKDIFAILNNGIRSSQTVDKDIENIVVFSKFIHNEAGALSDDIVKRIVSNKNFVNFSKVAIVKKLFKCYTQIKNNLGIKGIYSKYGKIITSLRQKNYISPNFRDNLFLVTKFFESNQEISPASPMFSQLFEIASKIESDLGILEMGEALKDLLKNYKQKSPNLFDLDYNLRNDLRFRVLRDKDPRILRIGIETDCCQRLGGVGEVAARDSFMNPLSSVLVLEWLDPADNDWKLLTQSYFHYVPEDNGYILDNVESNRKNVGLFKERTQLSLEEVYAVYATEIKNKLDVSYFLSGKGYSKIDTNKFTTDRRDDDPRFLDDRALTKTKRDHYSDYDEYNGINLLEPNFNLDAAKDKVFAQAAKQARLEMRRFIQAILRPPGLARFAQTQPATPPTPDTQTTVVTQPPTTQDIKTLPGVNARLFGPQSWLFLNQFMNELNNGLFKLGQGQKLGNQTINFQTASKNPTGLTRFAGGLKNLFKLATKLWHIVTDSRTVAYTVDDAKNIIHELTTDVNTSDFPEPDAQSIKPKLISILNNWSAILS